MYPRWVYRYDNQVLLSELAEDAESYTRYSELGWYATVPLAMAAAPSGTGVVSDTIQLLEDAYTTVVGTAYALSPTANHPFRHVTMTLTGSGAVTATVVIQRINSQYEDAWTNEYEVSLSGTNSDSWGGTQMDNGGVYRAVVTAITGTLARVNVWVEK